MPDFDLNESVYFSQIYYRRGKRGSEMAECLMCEAALLKTSIRTLDGATRGLGVQCSVHLRSKHFEYFEQFGLKRTEVLKRRTGSKILKRKSLKNEI